MFCLRSLKNLPSKSNLQKSPSLSSILNRQNHNENKNSSPGKRNVQLLSGIQPTGNIHLGNYFGAIYQWVEFQNRPELIIKHDRSQRNNDSSTQVPKSIDYSQYNFLPPIIEIVDLHSLTTINEPAKLYDRIFEVLAVLLGCGIDPDKCILFKQSSIPYHGHLCWILGTLCTLPQLSRFPQFKVRILISGRFCSISDISLL